jgi:hypothetical protein
MDAFKGAEGMLRVNLLELLGLKYPPCFGGEARKSLDFPPQKVFSFRMS